MRYKKIAKTLVFEGGGGGGNGSELEEREQKDKKGIAASKFPFLKLFLKNVENKILTNLLLP